ncbi:MAG: Helix-turn-helix domain [Solirubrobacterales bacterium]|nr:Helix-turn-helix domain [Solirubrobacterales bacterium]
MPRHLDQPDELARLGVAVRKLREECRLSRSELAGAAGIPERRMRALEDGRLDPDYVLLVRVAKALGVRPSALILRAEGRVGEGGGPTDTLP